MSERDERSQSDDSLGFRRITVRDPKPLLETIKTFESVHAIRDCRDLKDRLDGDRRLYALFPPDKPNDPLAFVSVALVKGMAGDVRALLERREGAGDPTLADSAIFYSINRVHVGLTRKDFGHSLIVASLRELPREFPNLKLFATLSPIPGFRGWLDRNGGTLSSADGQTLVALDEMGQEIEGLKDRLLRLCARYLVEPRQAARRSGRVIDPVAHFHLSNGASIERLNWWSDPSPKGIAQSAGITVNYLYDRSSVDANRAAYRERGEIRRSPEFAHLLDDGYRTLGEK